MCDLCNYERYFKKLRRRYRGIDDAFIAGLSDRRTAESAASYEILNLLYIQNSELFYPPGLCELRVREYLLSIPNIVTFTDETGTARFYRLR